MSSTRRKTANAYSQHSVFARLCAKAGKPTHGGALAIGLAQGVQ
jgi:hypothetical protein